MSKVMLIDAAHSEETRVAVVDGEKLEKYDFEVPSKCQIKGNIYLAKVVRVEPSLQAAFLDYGGDRHGFLSFSEIHPDYFQIPVEDRESLEAHIQNLMMTQMDTAEITEDHLDNHELARLRYQFYRRYKIQEVIKKRQIMLVQITKEERGNKGAAMTTYISLAGRYCVYMPNTPKGSGISKKINDSKDRAKLKKIVAGLPTENGSVVIRTAGIGHTKAEIKKDFDCLQKNWDEIRETTLQSTAPCLINEEANVIKRSVRDLYSRDVENIIVEGKEAYQATRNFVKKIIPGHVKKVKLYDDPRVPIFSKYKIADQISQIYSTRVDLPSGGYLVINATEALIAVDVNSGKATRERNIASTALKTNLEAAVEIARQCRLRDLAGLVVVDFIDMEEKGNNTKVEKCLREALKEDKAKLQIGNISAFGLLEFSRKRLGASIIEANMNICPHCHGTGLVWSNEFVALQILRKIDETCSTQELSSVNVTISRDSALYLLNHKRDFIVDIEKRNNLKIVFNVDPDLVPTDFKIFAREKNKSMENFANDVSERDLEQAEVISESVATDSPEENEPRQNYYQKRRKFNNRNYNKIQQSAGNEEIAENEQQPVSEVVAEVVPEGSSTENFEQPIDDAGENGKVFHINNNKKRFQKFHNRKPKAVSANVNETENPEQQQENAENSDLENQPKKNFKQRHYRKKQIENSSSDVVADGEKSSAEVSENDQQKNDKTDSQKSEEIPSAKPFDFIAPIMAYTRMNVSPKKESKEMKKKRLGWWQSFIKEDDE